MDFDIDDVIDIPDDAGARLRIALDLAPDAPLRIAYVCGPGDVVGTFNHWKRGIPDPGVLIITYSSMFYSLTRKLGAQALLIVDQDRQPEEVDDKFIFAHCARFRNFTGLSYHRAEYLYARRVANRIKAFDPHVVLLGTDAPLALFFMLPTKSRKILTAHNTFWPMGSTTRSLRQSIEMRLRSASLRHVDAAVCTSVECQRQIETLSGLGKPLFVETPQVLERFIQPIRPRPELKRLLYLGRIEETKGIFDLLSVFEDLCADHPGLFLTFAGSGSSDARLGERIANLEARHKIHFAGRLTADAVHDLLEQTDLLVCPTRTSFAEGLAVVVLEAASHGVPSVISSVVPAKETVGDGCVVFPADSREGLASALRGLLEDQNSYRRLTTSVSSVRGTLLDRSRYQAILLKGQNGNRRTPSFGVKKLGWGRQLDLRGALTFVS